MELFEVFEPSCRNEEVYGKCARESTNRYPVVISKCSRSGIEEVRRVPQLQEEASRAMRLGDGRSRVAQDKSEGRE
jgi:hypothetical protein